MLVGAFARKSVFFTLFVVCLSTTGVSAVGVKEDVSGSTILTDVPGCHCPVPEHFHRRNSVSPYDYLGELTDGVNNQTNSVCDTLEGDSGFQQKYGLGDDQPTTGLFYHSTSIVTVESGSCQEQISAQNTCQPFLREKEWDGAWQGGMALSYCRSQGLALQHNGWIDISNRCRQSKSGKYELVIYLEPRMGSDRRRSPCTGILDESLEPFLTGRDWQEPLPGRRYACKEFQADGQLYHFYIVNIGRPPCETEEYLELPSTSLAVSEKAGTLAFMLGIVSLIFAS